MILVLPKEIYGQVKSLSLPGFGWHEPTAWSPMGVPTALDSVIIGGYTFIQPDSLARARHVSITTDGHLFIDRDLIQNIPGKLVISKAPGDAIYNEGKLVNGGRITINRAGNYGIRSKGELSVLEHSKTVIDSTVGIALYVDNSLFTCDGLLSVIRAGGACMYTTGSNVLVDSNGILDLSNGHNNGVEFYSSFVENKGKIDIDSVEGNGIYSNASLENYDSILISNVGGDLYANYDSLTNHIGGILTLSNSGTNHYGYYNDGYTGNYGELWVSETEKSNIYSYSEFYNSGKIICTDSDSEGIYLEGAFINDGSIGISKCETGLYIEDDSHFQNFDSLLIDSIEFVGLYNYDSLSNLGYFAISNCEEIGSMGIYNYDDDAVIHNTGKIELYNIDSIALRNLSQFINGDTIFIERIYDIGVYNEDSIYNGIDGYIDIRSINAEKPAIININGTIHNRNLLQVDNCEGMGIVNLGSIFNEDSISLSNLLSFGILNHKVFDNGPESYLSIHNIRSSLSGESIAIKRDLDRILKMSRLKSSSGLSVNVTFDNNGAIGSALLINNGQIILGSADVGLLNSGLVSNTGSINIDQVGIGINSCYPMSMTMTPVEVTVDNDGYIYMETDDGMIIGGGTTFNIGIFGELVIRSVDDDMLNVDLAAILDCAGILDVGPLTID